MLYEAATVTKPAAFREFINGSCKEMDRAGVPTRVIAEEEIISWSDWQQLLRVLMEEELV